jgi:hypothetical protein
MWRMDNRYAMVGMDDRYEPCVAMGVTVEGARKLAKELNLQGIMLFPQGLDVHDTGGMLYRHRKGGYKKGWTAEFAAMLSPDLLSYARKGGL